MITIPESARISRKSSSERLLIDKAREWITKDDRAPGIHASDVLNPRMAYWQRVKPEPLADRLVNVFLVGKVLHAFVLGSVDNHVDIGTTDDGSVYSDSLGLTYSPDKILDGKVRELKTSRSFYEPKTVRDVDTYCEQLLVYMAATGTTESELWILFLNFKDEEGKTSPQFRCYTFSISTNDLLRVQDEVKAKSAALSEALRTKSYTGLELCKEFMCGKRNCPYYEDCKPEGRYGEPRYDGVQRTKEAKDKRPRKVGTV